MQKPNSLISHKSQTKNCFSALNIQLLNTKMKEYKKQKHMQT